MNAPAVNTMPLIGEALGGGIFAGIILINHVQHRLIVSPAALGDLDDSEYIHDYTAVPGAQSFNDGLANTKAMAEAGSELAKRILGLDIDGHTDWYLPSVDELELLYRNLKPTTNNNSQWNRSGINLHAQIPTQPYTKELPAQTALEAFQKGGPEAFKTEAYWSSTQHASGSDYAWCQYFGSGIQYYSSTGNELRARAVRRLAI